MRWNKVVNLNEGQTEKTERNSREDAKAAKRRVAVQIILYCFLQNILSQPSFNISIIQSIGRKFLGDGVYILYLTRYFDRSDSIIKRIPFLPTF